MALGPLTRSPAATMLPREIILPGLDMRLSGRELDREASNDRRAACAGRWQWVGVSPLPRSRHDAVHAPRRDACASGFVRFGAAGVCAFARRGMRYRVDRAFVSAASAPMSGGGFRGRERQRHHAVGLRVSVVGPLHVAGCRAGRGRAPRVSPVGLQDDHRVVVAGVRQSRRGESNVHVLANGRFALHAYWHRLSRRHAHHTGGRTRCKNSVSNGSHTLSLLARAITARTARRAAPTARAGRRAPRRQDEMGPRRRPHRPAPKSTRRPTHPAQPGDARRVARD
jgi:hypothetical protein